MPSTQTSIPQQAANTRLTPNPGLLPTEQAIGAWFAVAAARAQMQELARHQQHQQLRAQLRAHGLLHRSLGLQLCPPAPAQGQRLSRTQQILHQQLSQQQRAGPGLEPPRTGHVRATSSSASSSSLGSQHPQQAPFTNPAGAMAAAVAIAGAHNRKPVVSAKASSPPAIPSKPAHTG